MKVLALISISLFLFACAPLICPDIENIKTAYSQDGAPKNYSAVLSTKYGPLKLPLFLDKKNEEYHIKTLGSEILFYKGKELCVNSVCLDLPITPDGIIFGKVLKGDETPRCTREGVLFEKDDSLYTRKYVFLNGQLEYLEILDKKKDKTLIVRYGEKAKEGYYKSVDLTIGNLYLKINTEEVKVF